jgi:hypothetical protein
MKEIIRKTKFIISFSSSSGVATRCLLVGLPETSHGWIRGFPNLYHSNVVIHAHISPGVWTIGPLMVAVQRHSLAPLDMIMIIIIIMSFSSRIPLHTQFVRSHVPTPLHTEVTCFVLNGLTDLPATYLFYLLISCYVNINHGRPPLTFISSCIIISSVTVETTSKLTRCDLSESNTYSTRLFSGRPLFT